MAEAAFADALTDLGLEGQVVGDCRTKVSEVLDHFQGVVPYGDTGHVAGILSHHVGFKAIRLMLRPNYLQACARPFLSVRSQSSVVSKEHLSEQEVTDLGLALKVGEIEQLTA